MTAMTHAKADRQTPKHRGLPVGTTPNYYRRTIPLIPSEEWEKDSLCRRFDPDLFSPGEGKTYDPDIAQRICDYCPVIGKCGEKALKLREPWGVWGGLTPSQRDAVRLVDRSAWIETIELLSTWRKADRAKQRAVIRELEASLGKATA